MAWGAPDLDADGTAANRQVDWSTRTRIGAKN